MSDEKLIDVIAKVPAPGAGGTVGTETATRIVATVKAHDATAKAKDDYLKPAAKAVPEFKPDVITTKKLEPKYVHPDPRSRGQKG